MRVFKREHYNPTASIALLVSDEKPPENGSAWVQFVVHGSPVYVKGRGWVIDGHYADEIHFGVPVEISQ